MGETMRKNFAQILKSGKVDYQKEYKKLYELLFERHIGDDDDEFCSIHMVFGESFTSFHFRGTCISLQEFDEVNGFSFSNPAEKEPTFEDLILIMEYFYNMIFWYQASFPPYLENSIDTGFLIQHIIKVADAIGYEQKTENGLTIFVEKNAVATAVAESDLIPDDLSYKLITYDHHSMCGDLEKKKSIIVRLASILEGKQAKLNQVSPTLKKDLFYIFNNFNIRHNNCDNQSKDYKPAIAAMDKKELEKWYDETYQMCLLALMEIEQADRKPMLDEIKAKIESK